MSFESTLPHKCNFVIFGSKQEEVEAFTVKETAELINIRVDIERHYWEAIINGDTKRALSKDSERRMIDRQIARWEITGSNEIK